MPNYVVKAKLKTGKMKEFQACQPTAEEAKAYVKKHYNEVKEVIDAVRKGEQFDD